MHTKILGMGIKALSKGGGGGGGGGSPRSGGIIWKGGINTLCKL